MRWVILAGLLLSTGCIPCDLEVRGVCVSFNTFPREEFGTDEEWIAYLDHGITQSLEHWGRGPDKLDGWTIRFKEAGEVDCGLLGQEMAHGCTNPVSKVIRLEWPEPGTWKWPLAVLPHEVGHAVGHWSHHDGRFDTADEDAWVILDGYVWPAATPIYSPWNGCKYVLCP